MKVVLKTQVELPIMSKGQNVVQDYPTAGLSLKAHPVSFVRFQLDMLNIRTLENLQSRLPSSDTLAESVYVPIATSTEDHHGELLIKDTPS